MREFRIADCGIRIQNYADQVTGSDSTEWTNKRSTKQTARCSNTNRRQSTIKGPTEKLRDDEKSDAGELVPGERECRARRNPDSEEIKDEKGPNTE